MHCPSCNGATLVRQELEPGLAALACATCGGEWLRLADYAAWRRTAAAAAPSETVDTLTAQPAEPPPGHVRRCPDCHALLGRYRVGRGASFQIDRCAQCNGTWLDRDEWQQLRRIGVAAQLSAVFSPEWQQEARRVEQVADQERRFAARIGKEDLERAREMRDWLASHPQRNALLAYLELLPARTASSEKV
jgi:Zn-finger nucleic acid-binding protein